MLGNYRVAAQLVASRAVLSFTELVIMIVASRSMLWGLEVTIPVAAVSLVICAIICRPFYTPIPAEPVLSALLPFLSLIPKSLLGACLFENAYLIDLDGDRVHEIKLDDDRERLCRYSD
jgi:hypothetical protein